LLGISTLENSQMTPPGSSQNSLFVKAWFIPTWVILISAKLAIRLIPFKRIAPLLGRSKGTACSIPLLTRSQTRRAKLVASVISSAARYVPSDSNCYPEALTAVLLLRLYGIPYAFFFGLKRDPSSDSFKAHAWAASGTVRLTGGGGFDEYTVVGCFICPRLAMELEKKFNA